MIPAVDWLIVPFGATAQPCPAVPQPGLWLRAQLSATENGRTSECLTRLLRCSFANLLVRFYIEAGAKLGDQYSASMIYTASMLQSCQNPTPRNHPPDRALSKRQQ